MCSRFDKYIAIDRCNKRKETHRPIIQSMDEERDRENENVVVQK
jgi:hypothetical protein